MATIREMRIVCQLRRPDRRGRMVWAGHWFNRFVSRWISIYFTWFFVRLNISANTVTVLMIFAGLSGIVLCIPHLLWLNIIGAVLLFLQEILDCTDGEVARWNKKSSLRGFYLDRVCHWLCNAPLSCICAFHLYSINQKDEYLILAFMGYAMAQIRMGLSRAYVFLYMQIPKKHIDKDTEHKSTQTSKIKGVIKTILHLCVDDLIIKAVSVTAILTMEEGLEWPLYFLSWWFVIFGFIHNVGDIISKYCIYIPEIEHIKTDLD
jgi:phosphatidylglycerophosphate synthase